MTHSASLQQPAKILILESEYLVALDAERILREAFPCEVSIGQPKLSYVDFGAFDYDLVLLEVGPSLVESARIARRFCEAGIGVILSSVGNSVSPFRTRRNVTVVPKPYDERTLVDAVRSKL